MSDRSYVFRISALLGLLLLGGCPGGEPEPPPPPPPPISVVAEPVRVWTFREYTRSNFSVGTPLADGVVLGELLQEGYNFGPVHLDLNTDNYATGEIFATESGGIFSVWAQSPAGGNRIGSESQLVQWLSFRKLSEDATFEYTITRASLNAYDGSGEELLICEEEDPDLAVVCERDLLAWLQYSVEVYQADDLYLNNNWIFASTATAAIVGWDGNWILNAGSNGGGWVYDDFDDFGSASEDFGILRLRDDLTITVDLSTVPVGEEFTVKILALAETRDFRQRETAIDVYFRDPLSDPSTTPPSLSWTELEVIDDHVIDPPAFEPGLPPECVTKPAAGRLQFAIPEAEMQSQVGKGGASVFVTRTHGNFGEVSARVTTSGGSAVPGSDYVPVDTVVTFPDGVVSPREVRIPLFFKEAGAPDVTIETTLSAPTNCAVIGPQAETTTAVKNVVVPHPKFTVGGTVSGLVGSGLELRVATGNVMPGNGPFTFPIPLFDGSPYDVSVATQPGNPGQICKVTNGSGVIAGANVTDVAVDCVTPPPNGALDPDFGDLGKASEFSNGAQGQSVARQSDGKLVVAGGSQDFEVFRFNADGSLDTGFANGGIASVDFDAAIDEGYGVAIQSDGKIVVGGSTRALNGSYHDFALARLNTDGSLDTSFGSGGRVTTDIGGGVDTGRSVVIQSDGFIVLGGHARNVTDTDFAIARYDTNGTLDAAFGTGGIVTTHLIGNNDLGHSLALQPDNRIVIAGRIANGSAQTYDFGLARYNTDGSLDLSFGTGGWVATNLSAAGDDSAQDVAIQADGMIIVAGYSYRGFTTGRYDFALVRYNSDGSLDQSFGNNGEVTTALSANADDFGQAVAVQDDGRIVVAGRQTSNTITDVAITRYNKDGSLDSSFGINGSVSVDFHGRGDSGQDLLIQPDGRIVVAGYTANGTAVGVALLRLLQ